MANYKQILKEKIVFVGEEAPLKIEKYQMTRRDEIKEEYYKKNIHIYEVQDEFANIYVELSENSEQQWKVTNATIDGFILSNKGKRAMLSVFSSPLRTAYVLQAMQIVSNVVDACFDLLANGKGERTFVEKNEKFLFLKWKDKKNKLIPYLPIGEENTLIHTLEPLSSFYVNNQTVISTFINDYKDQILFGYVYGKQKTMFEEICRICFREYLTLRKIIEIVDIKVQEKIVYATIDLYKYVNQFESKKDFFNFLLVVEFIKNIIMHKHIRGDKDKAFKEKPILPLPALKISHEGIAFISDFLKEHKNSFSFLGRNLFDILQIYYDIEEKEDASLIKELNMPKEDSLRLIERVISKELQNLCSSKNIFNLIYNEVLSIGQELKESAWKWVEDGYIYKGGYVSHHEWCDKHEFYKFRISIVAVKSVLFSDFFRDDVLITKKV
ncbi:MAG: hypothetical protein ACOCRX_00585 [Candidatus Woesearchaeota archaeon]